MFYSPCGCDVLFPLWFFYLKNKIKCILYTMGKKTIITPSYRIDNLRKIKQSISFEYIDEWIIVYDGNKIESNPSIYEENKKIKEYIHKCDCISGHGQRN
jgi:hypothetical protein